MDLKGLKRVELEELVSSLIKQVETEKAAVNEYTKDNVALMQARDRAHIQLNNQQDEIEQLRKAVASARKLTEEWQGRAARWIDVVKESKAS